MEKRRLADLPGWPRGLSRSDAAAYLGISAGLLDRVPVQSFKIGGRVLYDRVDLDRWLDERRGGSDPLPRLEDLAGAWDGSDAA